ncbi:MAG: hypothetical protein M0003_06505, partial [Acidithiobacillus sp.]|nr:hypothetical protein [Acidithiobacillus sp.]
CSCTMRTARSRTSGEYLGVLALFIMAPFSWKKEPPQNPGRFTINLYELGKFAAEGRRVAVSDLVTRYNEIVEEVETDPSLKIEFRQ